MEYSFVKVSYENESIGMDTFPAVCENHREIIRKQAAEGWRYNGYIPSKQTPYGGLEEIELIFEK